MQLKCSDLLPNPVAETGSTFARGLEKSGIDRNQILEIMRRTHDPEAVPTEITPSDEPAGSDWALPVE